MTAPAATTAAACGGGGGFGHGEVCKLPPDRMQGRRRHGSRRTQTGSVTEPPPATGPAGKRSLLSRLSLPLALALGAGCLYLALSGIDWSRMGVLVRQAEPLHLVAAALVYVAALALRAARWRLAFAGRHPLSFPLAFWTLVAGYFGNNILPARAGDFMRALLLGERERLSRSFVLGTVVLERATDALALSVVVTGCLALLDLPGLPDWLSTASGLLAAIALALYAAIVLSPGLIDRLVRLVGPLLPGRGVVDLLSYMAQQLAQGMTSVRKLPRFAAFVALTVLVWCLEIAVLKLTAGAYGVVLAPTHAALVIGALGLASAVPSTPGYVGVFQLVAVTVMEPLGYDREIAVLSVTSMQAMVYVVVVALGLTATWKLRAWRYLRLGRSRTPPVAADAADG